MQFKQVPQHKIRIGTFKSKSGKITEVHSTTCPWKKNSNCTIVEISCLYGELIKFVPDKCPMLPSNNNLSPRVVVFTSVIQTAERQLK